MRELIVYQCDHFNKELFNRDNRKHDLQTQCEHWKEKAKSKI